MLLLWCWSTLFRDVGVEVIKPLQGDNRQGEQNENIHVDRYLSLSPIGIVELVYQGITYTTREKVVDIGPIQMTAEKTKTLPLPPIVGGVALVGGIVLLIKGNKKG